MARLFYLFQAATAKPQWNSATAKPTSLQNATQKAATGTAKVINQRTRCKSSTHTCLVKDCSKLLFGSYRFPIKNHNRMLNRK